MKKILIILLLFAGYFAGGQTPITYTKMDAAGYQFKYGKFDTLLHIPFGDTAIKRGTHRPGALMCFTGDSLIYRWNGVRWNLIAPAPSSNVSYGVDSITYSTNLLCQWKAGISTCYTVIGGGGVDSVTLVGDQLCQFKSGISTCYTITDGILGTFLDSVVVTGNQLCQWKTGVSTCYTINNTNNGIDSVTYAAGQLCWWKGGIPTCSSLNLLAPGVDSVVIRGGIMCIWIEGSSNCYDLDKYHATASLNFDSSKILFYNLKGQLLADSVTLPLLKARSIYPILITQSHDTATWYLAQSWIDSSIAGVKSVSGALVNNTDPVNPIINTPTFQQTLDAGSQLNKVNTIDLNGNELDITSPSGLIMTIDPVNGQYYFATPGGKSLEWGDNTDDILLQHNNLQYISLNSHGTQINGGTEKAICLGCGVASDSSVIYGSPVIVNAPLSSGSLNVLAIKSGGLYGDTLVQISYPSVGSSYTANAPITLTGSAFGADTTAATSTALVNQRQLGAKLDTSNAIKLNFSSLVNQQLLRYNLSNNNWENFTPLWKLSSDSTGLTGYATQYDRTKTKDSLQTNIGLKLNISDTSSMLSSYGAAINSRLKISDTASMLSSYQTAINLRLKISDTASMLSTYQTAINLRLKISDTAAMLSPYQSAINTNTVNIATNTANIIRYAPLSSSVVTTDDTTTLTTVLNATGLSVAVAANRKYLVTVTLWTACDNTGGIQLGLSGPAGAALLSGEFRANSNSSTGELGSRVTTLGNVASTAMNTRAGAGWVGATAHVTTAGTAGNIGVVWRVVTLGQKGTIAIGSTITVQEEQ